jgi:predicted transcriptional regulator
MNFKMIDEIFKKLQKIDREHAMSLKEISEMFKEEEKKMAGFLQRLRKQGMIGFEKREVKIKATINYISGDKKAERIHSANPFFYWGLIEV